MLSESGLYGLSAASTQGLNVLLIPLYASVLGLRGVGEVALLNTTTLLLFTLAGFALAQSFFRSYVRDSGGPGDRARVAGVTMTLRVAVAGITVAGFFLLAGTLAPLLVESPADRIAVFLIGPTVLFDAIGQGPLQWLRAERQPRRFVLLSVGRALSAAVLAVAAVIGLQAGIVGVAAANLISAALTSAIGLLLMSRGRGSLLAWDGSLAASMLRFSAPLVPAAIALWALNLSDRFLLKQFVDATAVGVYVVGYTLGALVNLAIVQPFTLAWAAAKWEVARSRDGPSQLRRFHRVVATVGSLGALLVSAIGVDVLRMVVPSAAAAGRLIVPFSAFAYACYGIYAVVSTGLTLRDRTMTLGVITIAVGAVNVGLNLVLIPLVGIVGAGIATLASYSLLTVITALASPRDDRFGLDVAAALVPISVAFALSLVAVLGPDILALRLACIASFAGIIVLAGWLGPELAVAKAFVRNR